MVVHTQTPELVELRESVLEMMLSGHPNACLVCDHREDCEKYRPRPTKAGQTTRCGACSNRSGCSIREMSLEGPAQRRLDLPTIYSQHRVERDEPFIERDHNLCVLCGRCWRICEQIHGKPAISIINRGKEARIGTAFGQSWADAGCTFCGACVDICPTGTLTDRYARWHEPSQDTAVSTCTLCEEACTVRLVVSDGKVIATRMASFGRDDRLCAVGRFGYPQIINDARRLLHPMIRKDGELVPASWEEAIAEIAARLSGYRDGSFSAVIGPEQTREAAWMYEQFAKVVMNGRVLSPDQPARDVKAALIGGDYLTRSRFGNLEYLVAMDFLPSAWIDRADAVLPVAVLAELEGTVGSGRAEPMRLSKSVEPPGEARAEWTILCDLAEAMGGLETIAERPVEKEAVTARFEDYVGSRPRPRDDLHGLPERFRGHLLADSAGALQKLGLKASPARERDVLGRGFLIVEKQQVVPNFHRLVIEAPAVARHAKPGQFAIVMVHDTSERAPYTLVDWDSEGGTITLIIEEVGRSSQEIARLQAGDRLAHVSGPLGVPLEIRKYGTVVVGGGCFGIGGIYPIARALREAGNRVIGLIEACSGHMLLMENEMKKVCDELLVATKDGSRGRKGGVQDLIVDMHADGRPVDLFVCIGCAFMMRMAAEKTRGLGIALQVALNPIMVDGTGMCGACRVGVGKETKFACVDGPFFDGHAVDWDELFARRNGFVHAEISSMPQHTGHVHGVGGGKLAIKEPGLGLPVIDEEQAAADW